ncbi:hypothetical protein IB237_15380 [Agrobacterium sp. AGB01]|uniref:hypothetical protein n=1 Tax=Agrobacterium sp. AGB01 TaxID=2769302 RepID=UPI00177FF3D7|nr:hypothetical protein [Agrobacterium sp. AGB01]MBD9388564.1 hypothetical protein [Agrobacterium sp. AGB01]
MVIEVDAAFYRKGTHIGNAARYDISGEAGVIEVAPAKYLFFLLPGFDVSTASLTFIRRSRQSEGASAAERKMYAAMEQFEKVAHTADLSRDLYPVFVTFRDITDPASLIVIDPDKLTAQFGDEIQVRSVVISVQPKAAFPNKIQEVLPWLEDVGRARGPVIPRATELIHDVSLAQKITPLDFLTFDRWKRE